MRRRLSALSLVVLTACTGSPAADATGAEIFAQVCARCHSADLSGGIGPPLGEGSELATRPDDYISDVIARGRGAMPAFRSTLSEAQIARVVDYLRSRQG